METVGNCTITGDATLTVEDPGVTATVLTMVAPAGTFSTVAPGDGGIFWVAAAAAAKAAIPLIWGLLPIGYKIEQIHFKNWNVRSLELFKRSKHSQTLASYRCLGRLCWHHHTNTSRDWCHSDWRFCRLICRAHSDDWSPSAGLSSCHFQNS